ncbi:MAG: hypothetical protein AAF676_12845 [Pseudomonadota bacterium]
MKRLAALLRLALAFSVALSAPMTPRAVSAGSGAADPAAAAVYALLLCSGLTAHLTASGDYVLSTSPGADDGPHQGGDPAEPHHCLSCKIAKAPPEAAPTLPAAGRAQPPGPWRAARDWTAPPHAATARGPPLAA